MRLATEHKRHPAAQQLAPQRADPLGATNSEEILPKTMRNDSISSFAGLDFL